MSTSLKKNLLLCFTKPKSPSSPSPPLQEDPNRPLSTSPSSSTLIKNFNHLYDPTLIHTATSNSSTTASHELAPMAYETANPPDLSGVFASQRFFFSSPGRSNSIIDSSSLSSSLASTTSTSSSDNIVGGSIAIPTYSPDPYFDFRRSMQEMVETQGVIDVRANWDYLHELLMCYLSLNPKSNHKFIVGAFSDLLVSLLE